MAHDHDSDGLARLAGWLLASTHTVALTGAGVSTESGIPDFRSAGGLWSQVDAMRVASIDGFLDDPVGFYRFWGDKFSGLVDARPNVTHEVLAGLEASGRLQAVITQNIDDLHAQAGSKRVLEVHGNFRRARCLGCGRFETTAGVIERVRSGSAPSCPGCGTLVKPDIVLFGEMLPPAFSESARLVEDTKLLLVLGCSLMVYPVAELVPSAHEAGAKVVLVNRDATAFDASADLVIRGSLGAVMGRVRELMAAE